MDIIEWLKDVKKLDDMIDAKLIERDRLMTIATNMTPKYDAIPVGNTGTVSRKVENAAIKLAMLSDQIDKLIDQYINHKQEVISVLEKLPTTEYGVMHRHYIRHMTWNEIAEDMCYSPVQIWRIHKKALKKLEDEMKCN